MSPSTLMTRPASMLDFIARMTYFALAPLGIISVTLLFPVEGALINTALALIVFVAAETAQRWAGRSGLVRRFLLRKLEMRDFYRSRPPRAFAYYVFYPLLFPYWLINRDARREFWLFKGYNAVSVALLLVTAVFQYFRSWPPQLSLRQYLPVLLISLVVEALLVLGVLMPIATSVIWYHQTMRRGRLIAVLLVGLLSTSVGLVKVLHRRDPVVSFSTRYRVHLRSDVSPGEASAAQMRALRGAWTELQEHPSALEGDGKVEGEPLDAAHAELEKFYKSDEALAFDLWASPRHKPSMLVLYYEARPGIRPTWIALKNGVEIRDARLLPQGAFRAMKRAAAQ